MLFLGDVSHRLYARKCDEALMPKSGVILNQITTKVMLETSAKRINAGISSRK